ncbi:MAG: pyruvate formate lyase family protein, partial [Minisyncoccia bacterium]
MKKILKNISKKLLKHFWLYPFVQKYMLLCKKYSNNFDDQNLLNQIRVALKILPYLRFVIGKGDSLLERKADIFQKTCKRMKIFVSPKDSFMYTIDPFVLPIYRVNDEMIPIGNLTINYSRVFKKGFKQIEEEIRKEINLRDLDSSQEIFLKSLLKVLKGVETIRERYLKELKKLKKKVKGVDLEKIEDLIILLSRVPMNPSQSFKEALQSILFVNSLIWTCGHPLVGLGRLDQILYPYFKQDIKKGIITKKDAYEFLKEFLLKLHKWYQFKSNVLPGDTGQVIIIGGKNPDGSDASNELSYMILDALRELKLPDPKLVARVHSNTPLQLWEKAFDCVLEGLGYPLFSNDEVIIPALIQFGYDAEDSYNYVTSACWEPLIPGKSLDQNNIATINFLDPLNKLFTDIGKNKIKITNFGDFLESYKETLGSYLKILIKYIEEHVKFGPSPFLSLLVENCTKQLKDISENGAKYNNLGFLSIALGNTVNALLNVKRVIFEERKISLEEVSRVLRDNFRNYDILLTDLKNKGLKFCMDEKEVISLTNEIINFTYQVIEKFKNIYGGKYKFGLSSPAFINMAKDFPASFDGRKRGE